jgi:hypothetical protein
MPAPSYRLVATVAFGLVVALAAPAHALFGGTLPMNQCVDGKLGCIAKARHCLLKCYFKTLKHGVAVDPSCVAKCRDHFEGDHTVTDRGCFATRERLGGCGPAVGGAGTFGARIDADVQEIVRQINPTGAPLHNTCASQKLGCVAKYDACILKLVAKAAESGTAIGDVSKCTSILDGTDASCIGKLEQRYCDPATPGCHAKSAPCLTHGDQLPLRNQDDAFADDAIQALLIGPTTLDTQRCSGDTSVPCASAPGGVAGCGGALGTCEFFVGPPQPLFLGGFTACEISRWVGAVVGTFDEATGVVAGTATVSTQVYFGVGPGPCPTCANDTYVNDGVAGGTCDIGPRAGMSCDGNGRWSVPISGATSLDCPPNPSAFLDTSVLHLSSANDGSAVKTITASSLNCNGEPGHKCLCASCSLDKTIACENDADCAAASAGTCTNNVGEPRQTNACVDDTAVPGDGNLCTPLGDGEGVCPEGPRDQHCASALYRGCLSSADCSPGDPCITSPRKCFGGYNGNVGDTVRAIGLAAPARNGAAATIIGSLACRPPTSSSIVNSVEGLPGPVRWKLAGVAESDAGPGCPTRLSFLPTSKGPALDLGWNGIGHDQRQIGEAKLTVATTCTGTHPSCSCTYTGPIGN